MIIAHRFIGGSGDVVKSQSVKRTAALKSFGNHVFQSSASRTLVQIARPPALKRWAISIQSASRTWKMTLQQSLPAQRLMVRRNAGVISSAFPGGAGLASIRRSDRLRPDYPEMRTQSLRRELQIRALPCLPMPLFSAPYNGIQYQSGKVDSLPSRIA